MYDSLTQPKCGCWYKPLGSREVGYLPQIKLDVHTTILASTSKTTLRQVFHNSQNRTIYEAVYTFPLYDGVSVAGFTYTVAGRTAIGVVKEKDQARDDYEKAKAKGQPVGLLEQSTDAADVFTSSIGNIPAGENVLVEITYLGELQNDAETDRIRFTIPTSIAPRYGNQNIFSTPQLPNISSGEMKITVDIVLEEGGILQDIQSPSHPVTINIGRTIVHYDNDHSLKSNLGSATLALATTELEKDFLLLVSAKGHDTPRALLETHPTIPNQQALLTTLVPNFHITQDSPEIVFVVDRSGSMGGKMHLVIDALNVLLKSLPVGVKFNICSFGSVYSFLFDRSRTYDAVSLKEAMSHIEPAAFEATLGGTEMTRPVEEVVRRRYQDLPLEVMLMTDGEIWNQDAMFQLVNEASKQNTRFFTLGIGASASSSLVEGIARAGRGFSQFVFDGERIDKRIVRMLRGALTPHIEYKLEVRYAQENSDEDDFEIIDSFAKNTKTASIGDNSNINDTQKTLPAKKKVSLFSSKARDEPETPPVGKYDHVPSISIPTVLQTPHVLPQLYSHSRTSVYLLLAPNASGRTPEAVVLRGSSKLEDLELEIPIQDIGKGETVHKLAAKKATQELEEGRGWLTALCAANGETLQSQNEGRWDLIIEREAVRLCTTFQVAGKHCSFIAVETPDKDAVSSTKDASNVVLLPPLSFYQRHPDASKPQYHKAFRHDASRGGFLLGSAPGGGSFGSSVSMARSSPGASRSMVPTGFGSGPDRSRQAFGQPHLQVSQAETLTARRRKKKSCPSNNKEEEDAEFRSHDNLPRDVGAMSALEKMQDLISLQAFTGSWSPSNDFLAVISHDATSPFNRSDVKEVVTEYITASGKSPKEWAEDLTDDDYATVLAIAWLEMVMKDESDVWEMVVEKARGYLEGRVDGSDQVNELIDDVRGLWVVTS